MRGIRQDPGVTATDRRQPAIRSMAPPKALPSLPEGSDDAIQLTLGERSRAESDEDYWDLNDQ